MSLALSDIRVKVEPGNARLAAYVQFTLDGALVVRDLKVIRDDDGRLFLSMPARPARRVLGCLCRTRNDLRAKFCRECGRRLGPADNDPAADDDYFMEILFPCSAAARWALAEPIIAACRAAGLNETWRERP